MRSIADDLRAESRQAAAQMTPAERIALALRLGDEDVGLLCAAHGLARAEAVRRIVASRRVGRLPLAADRGEP